MDNLTPYGVVFEVGVPPVQCHSCFSSLTLRRDPMYWHDQRFELVCLHVRAGQKRWVSADLSECG